MGKVEEKVKKIGFSVTALLILLMLLVNIGGGLPDTVVLFEDDSLNTLCEFPFTVAEGEEAGMVSTQQAEVKLLGVVPVKSIAVMRVQKDTFLAGGFPFGVKLFTKGVMVVGMSAIETESGAVNPALVAGIRKSDIILSAAGLEVNTIEELTEQIHSCGGGEISLSVQRGKEEFNAVLTPVKAADDNNYKVGMWVRDSTAGIGTVTFYRPSDGTFGGLGHGICDVDTGELMPLMSGTVVGATIIDVKKGLKGTPGELVGVFDESVILGTLKGNSQTGIFGTMDGTKVASMGTPVELGSGYDVKVGQAQILCCIDETGTKAYDIQIEDVYKNSGQSTKNMVIRITDPELLEKTGGIVQGMSGSPILQDGKLVGAVTHVLINDPSSGYGIFIENMLCEID